MKGIVLILLFTGGLLLTSCSDRTIGEEVITVEQNKDLASRINSERPVKISLKRKPNGTYAWDISGSDVKSILEADRQLRKELGDNK